MVLCSTFQDVELIAAEVKYLGMDYHILTSTLFEIGPHAVFGPLGQPSCGDCAYIRLLNAVLSSIR